MKLDTTELIFADYDCNEVTVFEAMERADALIKESSSKAYESGFKEGKQAIEAYIAEQRQEAKDEFAGWLASIISVSRNIHGKNATIRLDTLETLLLDYSQEKETE